MERKKLGGTSVSTLKTQESDVASQVGSNKGNRAGFLKVDKGWNKFRIYPAHPGNESFMYPSVKYFVPADVVDETSKKTERKNKPVFNSKVHARTEMDVIEEYLKFLTSETLSHLQGPSLEAALKPVNYGGDYNLVPKTEWVVYAAKYNKDGKKIDFGRLSITTGTKNKLEKLIATEASDQEIVIEPFTDEEDGIAIILTYDPDAKDAKGKKDMKNFYNVELEQKKVDKFRIEYVPTPLTEKEVEEFLKLESLESMYKNSYRLSDFNVALAGIQIIDKECKFGVLKDPKFLEIVEEIKAYYPEDDAEVEEGTTEEQAEESSEEDDLTSLDRNALKRLILAEFGQGVIVVRTNYSDDDIRNMIREKRKESSEEVPEENMEEAPEELSETSEETSDMPFDKKGVVKASEGNSSLAAMRKKNEERKAAAGKK